MLFFCCYIYVTRLTCCFINLFECIGYRVVVNALFETLIVLVLTTLNISNDPVGSLVTNWDSTLKRDRRLKFEGDSKSYQVTNKGSIALPWFCNVKHYGIKSVVTAIDLMRTVTVSLPLFFLRF